MTDKKLIEKLKIKQKKWENQIYGVGETRIDLMIDDVIRELQTQQEEIEKYKYLYQKALDNTIKADIDILKKDKIIDEAISWIKSLHDSLIAEYGTWETEFSINGDNVEENKIKEHIINKVEKESKDG